MIENTLEVINRAGHEWTITHVVWPVGAAPYRIYKDDEFWSTADSVRDAMDEIEEEAEEEK